MVFGPNSGAQNAPPDLGRKKKSADILGLRWVPADLGGYKTRSWVRTDCTSDPGYRMIFFFSADLGGYNPRVWLRMKSSNFLIRAIDSGSADLILGRFFFPGDFSAYPGTHNQPHALCSNFFAGGWQPHNIGGTGPPNICKLSTSISIIGICFDSKLTR